MNKNLKLILVTNSPKTLKRLKILSSRGPEVVLGLIWQDNRNVMWRRQAQLKYLNMVKLE